MDVATRCSRQPAPCRSLPPLRARAHPPWVRARLPVFVLLFAVLLAGTAGAAPAPGAPDGGDAPRIDINTASADRLAQGLTGIGAVKAQAIVAHREANGPFTSVDGLLAVKGIGPKTLERLRPLVTVGEELAAAAGERERATVQAVRRVIERSRRQAKVAGGTVR